MYFIPALPDKTPGTLLIAHINEQLLEPLAEVNLWYAPVGVVRGNLKFVRPENTVAHQEVGGPCEVE